MPHGPPQAKPGNHGSLRGEPWGGLHGQRAGALWTDLGGDDAAREVRSLTSSIRHKPWSRKCSFHQKPRYSRRLSGDYVDRSIIFVGGVTHAWFICWHPS